jgi:hypothetical protein
MIIIDHDLTLKSTKNKDNKNIFGLIKSWRPAKAGVMTNKKAAGLLRLLN